VTSTAPSRAPASGLLRRTISTAAATALVVASLAGAASPARAATPAGPFTVDLTNREDVREFYYRVHEASEGVAINWTGSVVGCNPGTVSTDFLEATRTRINYFRAMAGVSSDIPFTDTNNTEAQATALIMSAKKKLDHAPPADWPCWTQLGRDGAAASNLSLGNTGPGAIDSLMHDSDLVGHRRTMLNPQMLSMGSGSVPATADGAAAEAQLMVIDPSPVPHPQREEWVAWPPKGFVPYQTVYPLWNFTLSGGDFTNATVAMQLRGAPVPAVITSRENFAGPGIVWQVNDLADGAWPKPTADDTYTVTIANVLVGGVARTITYDVTVFDPAVADPARTPLVITGPDTLAAGQPSTFSVNPIPNATGFQWRTTKVTPLDVHDGAENGLANFTAVVGKYDPIDTTTFATGAAAFRLSEHAGFGDQTLTFKQTVLAGPDSVLAFKSRLIADQSLAARVQASTDDGVTWVDLSNQVGATPSENVFSDKVIPLGGFAGQQIRLRFDLTYLGGTVSTCCGPLGWYFDDVSLTNAQETAPPTSSAVSPDLTFAFTPPEQSLYDIEARAQSFGSGFGAWSPKKRVSSIPPVFAAQPQGQTVLAGTDVTLTAAVSGGGPLTFAWARNGVDLVDGADLQGATTTTLRLTNVGADQAGSYTLRATNASGTTTSAPAVLVVTQPAGLGTAVDNVALTWTTAGDANWAGQRAISHDGQDAAQSGHLVDGQSSRLETAVAGPVTLSFWWKVDSEPNFDFLSVSIDGVVQSRISGPVDWSLSTVAVPAGTHAVTWEYSKDVSVSRGADAGWVDQVTTTAPVTPPSLGDALDNPGLVWNTSGDRGWAAQTAVSHDGVDAAQSGLVTDLQSSRLEATVTGPATVSFWWKVTSETNFDFLTVAVDGIAQASISGPVEWELRTVAVPPGAHVVSWTYAKDRSVSVAPDAAWVDQVSLT